MSSISAVSSQISTGYAPSAAGVGDAGSVAAADNLAAPGGATSLQTSMLINSNADGASIDNLASLALALLLSKGSESKDKDDPWKILAGMAMLGALGRSSGETTIVQSNIATTQAYGAQSSTTAAVSGFSAQG